ncbi:MAG TPA: carboxypeptidase regulatory-like domain-containing protein, partial [Candidatus Limnocylindrales bacterium]
MARRQLAVLAAFALLIVQAGGALAAPTAGASPGGGTASAPIAKGLVAALNAESTDRFVVQFAAKADLDGAAKTKGFVKRGRAVLDALTTTAKQSQAAGLALAKKSGAKARSYWLLNQLVVKGDAKLAKQFAKLKGVTRVRALRTYPLVKPVEMNAAVLAVVGDPEWGVEKIRAPEAWAEGILGQGVVVANVDTGVDFTHPALVDHYRGNNGDGTFTNDYNWWDPTGICGDEPCDNAGHGTHTMGTMVGGDGPGPFTPDIGVAPAATWIAAKGCEEFDCTEESLLSAGQWILAPTDSNGANPDPSKRPDIVNNSWGGGPGDEFYHATVNAWRAAGIIPVFSSGNPGDACGDGGSPGDFNEVFSAGATDIDDNIADFSGRGPSGYGKVNPDISAPGVDVVSSVPGDGYESFSGTSMAAPHTSGTIALLLSATPALIGAPNAYTATTDAIRATAVDRIDTTCGGDDDGDPNNVYGDGRIDAKAAVDLLATGGTLAGDVTDDDSGDPVSGARVTAAGTDRDFSVTADSDGHYEIFLAAGTYDVTADAFGYATGLEAGVEITTDNTTTVDFALTALPRFNLTGTVRASEDGSPLSGAAVAALGTPVAPAIADGSGDYTLNLPIGTYSVRASAGGCTESVVEDGVEIVDDDVDLDFALGRKLDTFGHGCRTVDLEWVDATTDTSLFGDDFAGRLNLPFTFDFYGVGYNQVFISDNGYLTFGGADLFNAFPSPIPSESTPNGAVYALWRDLYVVGDGQISYATVGSPGNRAFVIEMNDVSVRGATSTVDIEIKLYEIGETVDILYGNNDANPGDGRGSTIGIEDADGTDALEFSFSDSLVTANTAYRYEVVPTGIVGGTVTDANDDEPIAGATVSASPGLGSTTTAADGSYSLRLYPGDYDLTFSASGYVTETQGLSIADGDELTRDVSLEAPVPTVDPDTVEVVLELGSDPVDAHVTLGNDGSAPLDWEAKERSGGSTPPVIEPTVNGHGVFTQGNKPAIQATRNGGGTALAHPRSYTWTAANPSADMSILVYADDAVHAAPDTYVDQALQRLGLSYTAHYDADFDGFASDLESGSWDLVIFADEAWGPDFALFDALNAYVVNGGRLIFGTYVVEFDPSHPLFETLGFSFSESVFDEPAPVYWWQPDHPIFTFPEEAPEPSDQAAMGYGIYGQAGDPLAGAEALAGYTTPGPDDGLASLVIANEERTAFKGWVDASNDADLDNDGVPDGVEFWEDAANGIASGFFTDVSWLSESPTDGTLDEGDTADVTLTIGDPNLAPGEHKATVVFRTNAPKPRNVTVDVTLTVPLPGEWGALEGTVTDADTDEPLADADVTLHSQWDGSPLDVSVTTDGDGAYSLLGPGGTWPLEFSKDGYTSVTRNQLVTPATTTTGVDARLRQRVTHGRIKAGDLTFVMTKGNKDTGKITLTNKNGQIPLTFEVDEANIAGAPSLAGSATPRSIAKVAPLARDTRGANRPAVRVPPKLQATGDILAAWPTEGLEVPWAVGFNGNVWIGDFADNGDACAI